MRYWKILTRETAGRSHRPWSVGVAAIALAVLAAVGALATIPDSSGVIHGCYLPAGGLRVIDDTVTDCRQSETAISWNVKGPTGPMGPQGIPGNTNVLTKSVTAADGTSASQSLTVPGFGSVDLACSSSGIPSIVLRTSGVLFVLQTNFTLTTATGGTAEIGVGFTTPVWTTFPGGPLWKVDYVSMTLILPRPPFPEFPCTAAVTVTAI